MTFIRNANSIHVCESVISGYYLLADTSLIRLPEITKDTQYAGTLFRPFNKIVS